MPDPRLEFARRALGDDPPLVHHRDLLREPIGLLEVLRGQQHRRPLATKLRDDAPQLLARARVEPGRGLVEQDDRRPPHQGRAQIQAAAHSARSR